MDALDLGFQFGRRKLLQSAGALAVGIAIQQSSDAANASGEIKKRQKVVARLISNSPDFRSPLTINSIMSVWPQRLNSVTACIYRVSFGHKAPAGGPPYLNRNGLMALRLSCLQGREKAPRSL